MKIGEEEMKRKLQKMFDDGKAKSVVASQRVMPIGAPSPALTPAYHNICYNRIAPLV